jgi:enoyl-[acyl-carrier protein] reductase II
MQIIINEGVKIVFTSAGNPKLWTNYLQEHGIKVAHVIANSKFALKCEEAGVDAIVAEGFEAGGHNGFEETTTMTLIPKVRELSTLPLLAAGGIGNGRQMLASMILGADGVQIGSRFVASEESSAHQNFKNAVVDVKEGGTDLMFTKLIPVRLIKNEFQQRVKQAEDDGASKEKLAEILGKARAKLGMFEGNTKEGELEIGQVSSIINSIKPAAHIISDIILEYNVAKEQLNHIKLSF